jgi:hypothetical protein
MSFPPGGSLGQGPQKPEPTTRERVARVKTLLRRAAGFWKGVMLLMVIAFVAAYFSMINTKRTYLSECRVVLSRGIKTGGHQEGGGSTQTISTKHKETLTERARLEGAIKKFELYPSVVSSPRGLLAATQEMKEHVGFRASESNFFYISFDYPEQADGQTQELVRAVTQYLGETLVSDYTKTNATEFQRDADFAGADLKTAQVAFDTANRDLVVFLDTHPAYYEAMQKMAAATGPLPGTAGAGSAKPPYSGLVIGMAPRRNPVDAKWQAIFEADPELRGLYGQRAQLVGEVPKRSTPVPVGTAPSQEDLTHAGQEV